NFQNVEIRSLLSKTLPKSYLNQLNVSLIDETVTVTEIWRMLEREFGESSATGVIGLLTKFVGTLTSDYRHVGLPEAQDFAKGYFRTSIFKTAKSGPAKVAAVRSTRSEVAVDQVEVSIPSGGERTAMDMEAAASLDDLTMQLKYAQLQGPTTSGT
ncbi:hypothetical protein DYB30_012382, partial [Aphanomyces astaci]